MQSATPLCDQPPPVNPLRTPCADPSPTPLRTHPPLFLTPTVQQVAFADKILLNKLDLVTPEQKAAVVARIKVSGPAWLAG